MKLLVVFSPANVSVGMFPRYRIDAIISISGLPLRRNEKKKREKLELRTSLLFVARLSLNTTTRPMP